MTNSTNKERCFSCNKLKKFYEEGHHIKKYWFCCWRCAEQAVERGFITRKDIKEDKELIKNG